MVVVAVLAMMRAKVASAVVCMTEIITHTDFRRR